MRENYVMTIPKELAKFEGDNIWKPWIDNQ